VRLKASEAAALGKPCTDDAAGVAASIATEGAKPLQYNAYKIPLMQNLVKRAIRGVPVKEAAWA